MNEIVPISIHFNYVSRLPFLFNSKSSRNRDSLIPLPAHILIRLLRSIIELLRLCLQELPAHLVVSIRSIRDCAKSGGKKISPITHLYRQNKGLFSSHRHWVDIAPTGFGFLFGNHNTVRNSWKRLWFLSVNACKVFWQIFSLRGNGCEADWFMSVRQFRVI